MIVAVVIATVIPLGFLFFLRWLNFYDTGNLRALLISLSWGVAASFASLQVNTFVSGFVSYMLMVVLFAPAIEEALKSLPLVYLVSRSSFTYFVDGAIYGFATGTAFAIVENLFYLSSVNEGQAITLALGRVLSTSLMHGSACALVGISLGFLRHGRGFARVFSLFLGWAAAISLHTAFNYLLLNFATPYSIISAMILGLGGLAAVAAFIFWGLRRERLWLKDALQINMGVSARESAVIQQMDELEILLAPVRERFGKEKCQQVESFLKLQVQLGIKRREFDVIDDEKKLLMLENSLAKLQEEMDDLRCKVGIYCMSYVRTIIPPETEPIWSQLAKTIDAKEPAVNSCMWGKLSKRIDQQKE